MLLAEIHASGKMLTNSNVTNVTNRVTVNNFSNNVAHTNLFRPTLPLHAKFEILFLQNKLWSR